MTVSRTAPSGVSHAAAARAVGPTTKSERKSESWLGLDMKRFDFDALEVYQGQVSGLGDSVVNVTVTTEATTSSVPGRSTVAKNTADTLGKWGVHDAKKLFDLSPADREATLRKMRFARHECADGSVEWHTSVSRDNPEAPSAFQMVRWNDKELTVRTRLQPMSKFKANGEKLVDEVVEELRVSKAGASSTTTAKKVVGVDVRPVERYVHVEEVEQLLREKGLELPSEM